MWFEYLKEQFMQEKKVVEQLLEIDYEVQGVRIYFEYCIQFLEQNKSVETFYLKRFSGSPSLVLEGNPFGLMKVLHDYGMCCYPVIILKNYYAFNRWILKKYEQFCECYSISSHLVVSIQDNFQIQSTDCVLFGSQAFLNEMKDSISVPCYSILESSLFYY